MNEEFHKRYLESRNIESKKETKNLLIWFLGILLGAWATFNLLVSIYLDL